MIASAGHDQGLPHASHTPARTGTASRVLAWLLAIVSLVWLAVIISWTHAGTPVIGMFSDSVWYLAIADFYRSLLGSEVPIHAHAAYSTSRFPPLYPLLIAVVGGGVAHQDIVNHLSVVLTVLAGLAVVAWLRTLGVPTLLALASLPLTYVTPALLDWLLIPLSEPLFLACLATCLIAAHRARAGSLDIMVVAALVCIVPLVRSAGIVLVVAFALWAMRMSRVSTMRRVLAIALAAAPTLIWSIYRSSKPVFLDYGNEISLARMLEEAGTLSAFAQTQIIAVLDAVQAWFGVSGWSIASIAITALAAAALRGWWARIRSWELDAIFVPLYIGMLLVWPYPLEMPRLVGVIMPITTAWAMVGVSRWLSDRHAPVAAPRARAVLASAVAATAVCLPAWAASVNRALLPVDAGLEPYKRTPAYFMAPDPTVARTGLETSVRILAVIEEATELVAPEECVHTTQTALVMGASRGRLRARPTPRLSLELDINEQLRECRYLLVMQLGSRQAHAVPLYPLQEVETALVPVLVSRQSTTTGNAIAAALLVAPQ